MKLSRLASIIAIVLALLGAGGEASSVAAARNLSDPSEHCASDPTAAMSLCVRVTRQTEASADDPLKPSLCLPQSAAVNPTGRHLRLAPPDSPVSLHILLSV